MRILFITATRLGDAVISTGLLGHLLESFPDARFTVACGPVAEGVFARMPRRDRTIVVEKQRFDAHWLALWREVAGQHWDLAVDLRGSALTLFLRAGRRVIMRGGRRPGLRLTHIAGAAGIFPPPLPTCWTGEEDATRAAALIPPGSPVIGLGPTANWAGKIWPAERFVRVAENLASQLPHARFAIFAGPGAAERAAASQVLGSLPGAIDLVGGLSVPEASACLARCRLFIGNDSGLMHLAAAAGAATLGLFGPTPAEEYAPSGLRTGIAVALPPGRMIDLPVDTVLRQATLLLDREHVPA